MDSLVSGRTNSCGCKYSKHGQYNSRLYRIWLGIKSRCNNQNAHNYSNYGGRGITISGLWDKEFIEFYRWSMENGYNDSLTIDRINSNDGYNPENCQWVDYKTQARNRSNTRLIEYNGKSMCLKDWSDELGINYNSLQTRLNNNWTIQDAFEIPIGNVTKYASK